MSGMSPQLTSRFHRVVSTNASWKSAGGPFLPWKESARFVPSQRADTMFRIPALTCSDETGAFGEFLIPVMARQVHLHCQSERPRRQRVFRKNRGILRMTSRRSHIGSRFKCNPSLPVNSPYQRDSTYQHVKSEVVVRSVGEISLASFDHPDGVLSGVSRLHLSLFQPITNRAGLSQALCEHRIPLIEIRLFRNNDSAVTLTCDKLAILQHAASRPGDPRGCQLSHGLEYPSCASRAV